MTLRHVADELDVLGIEVLPWEAQALRRLSRAWLNMKQSAKKPECPPPFGGVELMPERMAVSRKIKLSRAGASIRRVKRSVLAQGSG